MKVYLHLYGFHMLGTRLLHVQIVLRVRYFACKTIVFRPYLLAVLDNEQAALDPIVRENCRKCLDAAIRQLDHITSHHAGHMPYLWQGALSIVSQTLLVMGTTLSPSLSLLLPPLEEMNTINGVVEESAKYSHLAPSLALGAGIIKEAESGRQDILGKPGESGESRDEMGWNGSWTVAVSMEV